jgi:hypothetical protein
MRGTRAAEDRNGNSRADSARYLAAGYPPAGPNANDCSDYPSADPGGYGYGGYPSADPGAGDYSADGYQTEPDDEDYASAGYPSTEPGPADYLAAGYPPARPELAAPPYPPGYGSLEA